MIACADKNPMNDDHDLKRRVCDYLSERSVPALRRVAVEARQGQITFRGRVGTFYEKQLLLNCYHAVPGVVCIVDHVAVD